MNRKEFIDTAWTRYPSADNSWQDVSVFLERLKRGETRSEAPEERTDAVLVCGRINKITPTGLALSANGAQFDATWAATVNWLAPQKISVGVTKSWFQAGDLVCVRCNTDFVISGVLLLAPTLSTFSPSLNEDSKQVAMSPQFSVQRSRDWAWFLDEVRLFFKSRNFIEAMTPTLVKSPGTEPYLDAFSTHWKFGSREEKFYLPTSPEFHLKKLLAAGWTQVFELKTCFRNGEIGEHHQPEFLMLEWYRAYRDLDSIAMDVEDLLKHLLKRFRSSNGAATLQKTSLKHLFSRAFNGFDLRPGTSLEELRHLAKRESIEYCNTDSFDDLFFRLFLSRIEPELGVEAPILVRGYPPSQAALSRIGSDGFADRFELYWKGFEIANAFHELNDPVENEKRFKADEAVKVSLGKEKVPMDEDLLHAIYGGLPPTGGIALGLDRLFMALFDVTEIQETRAFAVRK